MENQAAKIIDALGGTSKVARLMDAPVSTVHSWRKSGIPASRLAHLNLLAEINRPKDAARVARSGRA